MTKLIDSNILIYAYDNSDFDKHAVAKDLVAELQSSGDGVISIQNLAEFSRALTEKAKPVLSHNQVRAYVIQLQNLFTILNYNAPTVAEALHLASLYRLHFFDSLLAATMEENLVVEILTENEKDFSKIPGLKVTNPFKRLK